MKKMIPVYVLLVAILGTCVFATYKLVRELRAIDTTLVILLNEQRESHAPTFSSRALRVEVVNTPTVEIQGTIDCDVNDPIQVEVTNEPLKVQTGY